jgi:hypothetical protein
MLQLTPVTDPGPATSSNNEIYIPTVTIAQINANVATYQARLVRIRNAHFEETGTFATGQNYTLIDNTGSVVFRTTFYDVDYIGQPIPTGNFNIWVLVNQYNQIPQVTARMLSDWSDVPINDDIETPIVAQLTGIYPNPFNPSTTISFYATKTEAAQITIFNQKGQVVRTWNIDSTDNGIQCLVWDGTDQCGKLVSSGVYYCQMVSGKYSSSRKMVLMK